eukprot:5077001-Amphidinium_carterae.1
MALFVCVMSLMWLFEEGQTAPCQMKKEMPKLVRPFLQSFEAADYKADPEIATTYYDRAFVKGHGVWQSLGYWAYPLKFTATCLLKPTDANVEMLVNGDTAQRLELAMCNLGVNSFTPHGIHPSVGSVNPAGPCGH